MIVVVKNQQESTNYKFYTKNLFRRKFFIDISITNLIICETRDKCNLENNPIRTLPYKFLLISLG